jgi:hypothetical protein
LRLASVIMALKVSGRKLQALRDAKTRNTSITWKELLLSDVIDGVDAFGGRVFPGVTVFENVNAVGEEGRFTSEDPARDGANWYVYCANNPLAFVDPSGLIIVNPDGSVTFDKEEDTFTEGAQAGNYKDWNEAFQNAALIDSSSQLVGDFKEWFNEDGTLSQYAIDNGKSLLGLTMSGSKQTVVYLLRGHSAAARDVPYYNKTTWSPEPKEKDVISNVTSIMSAELKKAGYFVALDDQKNWPNDTGYGPEEATDTIINNSRRLDLMLAIHSNSSSDAAKKGTTIWGPLGGATKNVNSYRAANVIFQSVKSAGLMNVNYYSVWQHQYMPLGATPGHEHSVPAALIEAGYYSNTADYNAYSGNNALAFVTALIKGVNVFFGRK